MARGAILLHLPEIRHIPARQPDYTRMNPRSRSTRRLILRRNRIPKIKAFIY